MVQTRELSGNRIGQEQFHPVTVHDVGRVHADGEHEPFRIDEQMALAALDLLAAVVAAHAPDAGGLDRLDAR